MTQAANNRFTEEVSESQGRGGLTNIKFATVEVEKKSTKKLVIKKIDTSS